MEGGQAVTLSWVVRRLRHNEINGRQCCCEQVVTGLMIIEMVRSS
jgi:hypothetical protein